MHVGVIVPQGWTGEYDGWDPRTAWQRSVAVAGQAERLGFESIWLFDHFHTVPDPTDEITFESFTSLTAFAALTQRVRLGHIVICAGFRNSGLTAKMISTMDVISGGRMELGIGAGWKEDEWRAYGYGFPDTPVRLAALGDQLEVITRMLAPGRATHATFDGQHAGVFDAINVPKPLQQPRVPIMVGGNGPNVTWRLAARFADELNVDGMRADEVRAALPVIGRFLAAHNDPEVRPDAVALAKGLGAGYAPLGAFLAPAALVDETAATTGFVVSHSYDANPIACAAGSTVLDEIVERDLLGNAARMGAHLRAGLERIAARSPLVGDVRGIGLLLAIELVADPVTLAGFPADVDPGAVVRRHGFDHGLLLYSRRQNAGRFGDWLLIAPPLVIDQAGCDELLAGLAASLDDATPELMGGRIEPGCGV